MKNNELPPQYASWYEFWIDVMDSPLIEQGYQKIRVAKGGYATSLDDRAGEWLEYYVCDIKAKALDEVLPFLPRHHNEVTLLNAELRMLPHSATDKPRWSDFHKLFS